MGLLRSSSPVRSLTNTLKMSAYAAVIGTATRLQGGHRPMPEEVEYAKPPVTDDPLYNDSHYFNFFDHDHGIGAFTRIGKLANRNASIGLFFIYLREGQAFIFAQSEHIPRNLTDLRSGSLRYEIVKPLEELRIVNRAKFLRLEWECTGKQLVEDDPQGIHVRTCVNVFTSHLRLFR